MNSMTRRHFPRLRRRRGFTLTEVMISVAISSLVMTAVFSMQFISGRAIKEVYGQTRTRSSRMRAIDQIHYRLVNASLGSVVISQEDHRITFVDPNLGGATSAFFFSPDTDTLSYDDDIGDTVPARAVAVGPIDITFEEQVGGAIVYVRVKSASHMAYADVDKQDGEIAVHLRNP